MDAIPEVDFSRMTRAELAEFQRRVAMLLWRRAPSRPTKAARMRTLQRAQCFAGLARALDENPNFGLDKWPPAR